MYSHWINSNIFLTWSLCLTESEHPVHSSCVIEATLLWPKWTKFDELTEEDEEAVACDNIKPGCKAGAVAVASIGGATVVDDDDDIPDRLKGEGEEVVLMDSFLAKYLRMQSCKKWDTVNNCSHTLSFLLIYDYFTKCYLDFQ